MCYDSKSECCNFRNGDLSLNRCIPKTYLDEQTGGHTFQNNIEPSGIYTDHDKTSFEWTCYNEDANAVIHHYNVSEEMEGFKAKKQEYS